ncbi:MAG: SDR family oxidoreductase [Thalassobaculales bacterium]
MDMFRLDGQVILVTGASRGLGAAIAALCAEAGAHVVLNGRDAATLAAGAEAIGGSVAAFDVSDAGAAAAGVAAILERHGRIDGLVNNAGINLRAPFEEMDAATFDRVMATDLDAAVIMSRAVGPAMLAAGRGRIVNTASVMGPFARIGVAPYATAKAGLVGFTRSLAVEWGPRGITVNAVAPGFIETDMNRALKADPAFDGKVTGRTPLGRWGEPREVAAAAVFLLSPAASYVNGHTLFVDGGMTVQLF